MSAEEELRSELMTEIEKNEQDPEQCNEETGWYNREFLYNVRDLEQLYSITECPLASLQLKESDFFSPIGNTEENFVEKVYTRLKERLKKRLRAKEDAARIERKRIEQEARRLNRIEEQLSRIVEARLERERIEKAEASERFNLIEEQLRRSEEARLEMERRMKEEQERKIIVDLERQIREEEVRLEMEKILQEVNMLRERTARLESEREEAVKRESENDARIEKERMDEEESPTVREYSSTLTMSAEEELRVEIMAEIANNEQDLEQFPFSSFSDDLFVKSAEQIERMKRKTFPILALPKELKYKVYRHFGLEGRRALRINEELAEIEIRTKYRYETLDIAIKENHVLLSVSNNYKLLTKCWIPHSEVEKELEIMAKNSQFNDVCLLSDVSDNRQIANLQQSIKAKEMVVLRNSSFNDYELQSIVLNREEVSIYGQTALTENGLFWIYEKMRERQFDLKEAFFEISETIRWNFLDKFGTLDRETMVFTGTNPNQMVNDIGDFLNIHEGELKIVIDKVDEDGDIGTVNFVYRSD